MAVRLVIAEDHPLVARALETLLSSQADLEVVGVAGDGQNAVDLVLRLIPDVLLLDLTMPRLDGIAVVEQLISHGISTRVLVFTGNIDERRALDCLRLGVAGVVLKEAPPEQLLNAVRKVAAGDVWLEKQSYKKAVDLMLRQGEARRHLATILTPREIEVMNMAAEGLRNKDIADRLRVTEGTVKLHLHRVFDKLGLRGRSDLVRYVHEKFLT
jgi:DNA-binding NarL/FixJ family response regulator